MKTNEDKAVKKAKKNVNALRYPFDEFWFREGYRKAKETIEDKDKLIFPKSKKDKTEYKCGHNGKPVILDSNELSITAYFTWKESCGFEGDKSMCFDCWCKQEDKS